MPQFDDAVIGAGIIGLAHAYHLAVPRRVAVFERRTQAEGRIGVNFGMIWPIGQPAGPARELALRSREIWLDVARASGLWSNRAARCTVFHDDEWQVLREFAEGFAAGLNVELVAASRARSLSPRLELTGLRGALWSPTEICVDARRTCRRLDHMAASNIERAIPFRPPGNGI